MTYLLERQVQDHSLRVALRQALKGDGQLSLLDTVNLVLSTLDGDGVTPQEYKDLQHILGNSKTLDQRSKDFISAFLAKNPPPQHEKMKQKAAKQKSGQLTKNFNVSEFACNDGTPVPQKYIDNVKKLATNLQALRDHIGKPIHINSSYRHPEYNKKVGGASKSQHLVAKAADIRVNGMPPAEVKKTILSLIRAGSMEEGGIGLYNTFVHYDVRGRKARW